MRFTGYPYAAAAAACALLLSACSGGNSVSTMPAGTNSNPASQQHPQGASASALYASDFYGKSVFRFARNADGTLVAPAGSSLVLSYNPGAIAIGSTGNLFVADEENESIEVYPKDASGYQPANRTLLLPFVPSAVAVDGAGYEYAGGFTNAYVAVYAPGAKGTAKTIQRIPLPDGHPDINGLAIDSKGQFVRFGYQRNKRVCHPAHQPDVGARDRRYRTAKRSERFGVASIRRTLCRQHRR